MPSFFIQHVRMSGFTRMSQKSEVKLLTVELLPGFVNVLKYTGWAVKGLDLSHGNVCNFQGTPNMKYRESHDLNV